MTEALEGLLFRAEGGLVRTGLTWLDQIVRRAPARADELAPALATALGHGAHAVQERAVRLAVKHARHLTPLGAETLRAALAALPPDLGRRLAGAVGGEAEPEEEPEAFTPPELTAPEPPGPFPALPASVAEFENTAWFSTWQSVESWLASFARFAAEDREALRVALGRRTRHAPTVYGKDRWYAVSDWFTAMAAELVSPGAEPEGGGSDVKEAREFRNVLSIAGEVAAMVTRGFIREFGREVPAAATRGFLRQVVREVPAAMTRGPAGEAGGGGSAPRKATPDRLPGADLVSVPHRFLLRRCAEVLAALKEDRLPSTLLATPTHDTGHLDPAEFLTRLEAVEAAGAEPLPADFQQALLRLPRTAGPEIVARAARLTSEAGRRAARWLADGPADPETGVRWKHDEDMRPDSFGRRAGPAASFRGSV